MLTNDKFDELYKYLAYPIHENVTIFSRGMPIKTKELDIPIRLIAYDEQNFLDWLEDCFREQKYSKYVCILKIPTYYLGRQSIKDEYHPCMPLIRTNFNYVDGEKNYVIPKLILGIYDIKKGTFQENPDYNPLFNPNGLQFTDEQISNMPKLVQEYAINRRTTPYEVLLSQDELSGVFDSTIEHYQKLNQNKPYQKIRIFKDQ